jgi:hypothetical protein
MTCSVLLDTSFLISLVDSNRAHHAIAKHYYKYLLEQKIPLYFSAIVASEFSVKQPITDLELHNFIPLPFNIPHSIKSAEISNLLNLLGGRDNGDNRVVLKDDIKIIAQALCEKIPFILTDDAKTFYKYCERLQTSNGLNIKAIKLEDGFQSETIISTFSLSENQTTLF